MKKIILLSVFVYGLTTGDAQTPGDLDSSFGTNGIVLSDFGIETYFTITALQNDGKIVAAGYTFNGSPNLLVARYKSDGSSDSTFSDDGVQVSNYFSAPDAMAIQNDGKIVLAVPGSIIRYNSDGSLDNSFILTTPFNINSLAVQSDGKIIGVGYATNGSNFDVTLVRYNIDGSLDNSFSDDGKQFTDFGGFDEAHNVAIQSDGKIIISGTSDFNFAIARYNTDGTLDNSFSSDGKQTTNIGGQEDGTSLAIQTDGKIVVGGNIYKNGKYAFCLARYKTDGSLDSSFSIDGKQVSNFTSYAYTIKNSLAIQTDGKIIMGGNSSVLNNNTNQFTLIRYKADGSIDLTFSGDGKQTTDISEGSALLYSIAIAGNKLYAVGFSQSPSHRGIIARYLLNETGIYPTVDIAKPAGDTTYIAPAKIKITAVAADEDGSINKVEFYNGNQLLHTEHKAPYNCILVDASVGNYSITAKAIDNSGNATFSSPVNISVVPNIPPTVSIKTPVNNESFTSPANVVLNALANDVDGRIIKVDFYNGNNLIFTETAIPYSRKWFHLREGNYAITARATDNNGAITTSDPVNISVVPDVAPMVSITSPANGATYTAPASIQLSADASDIDGIVRTVDFYNGNTLLFSEKYAPYSNSWLNVPEGNYSITAVATDNNGKTTTSAPVAISVEAAGRPIASGGKLNFSNTPLSLNVNPNPVSKTLNVSIDGLKINSKSSISILSVSGVVIKTIQSTSLNKITQLNVSSLSAGVYYIKIINGDKVLYKQFVKL